MQITKNPAPGSTAQKGSADISAICLPLLDDFIRVVHLKSSSPSYWTLSVRPKALHYSFLIFIWQNRKTPGRATSAHFGQSYTTPYYFLIYSLLSSSLLASLSPDVYPCTSRGKMNSKCEVATIKKIGTTVGWATNDTWKCFFERGRVHGVCTIHVGTETEADGGAQHFPALAAHPLPKRQKSLQRVAQ